MRQAQTSALKDHATGIARLRLVKGTPEDGDPSDRLIEIQAERYPGIDKYARQEAMSTSFFGFEDKLTRIKHNDELNKASQAAAARLPALREAFNKGLQPGEYIMVKAPFPTPSHGKEWMWVEVMSWQGEQITGLLKNEPVDAKDLHAGQKVRVSQADLFDYLRRYPDGREEGNETGMSHAAHLHPSCNTTSRHTRFP